MDEKKEEANNPPAHCTKCGFQLTIPNANSVTDEDMTKLIFEDIQKGVSIRSIVRRVGLYHCLDLLSLCDKTYTSDGEDKGVLSWPRWMLKSQNITFDRLESSIVVGHLDEIENRLHEEWCLEHQDIHVQVLSDDLKVNMQGINALHVFILVPETVSKHLTAPYLLNSLELLVHTQFSNSIVARHLMVGVQRSVTNPTKTQDFICALKQSQSWDRIWLPCGQNISS